MSLKAIILVAVFGFFSVLATAGFAGEASNKRFEIGVSGGGASVSSSPIPGIPADAKMGYGVRFVTDIRPDTSVVLGVSQRDFKNLEMGGMPLGNVGSTSFSVTGRYNFRNDSQFTPYLGGGVNFTTFDGSLANGKLHVNSNGGVGTVIEGGLNYKLPSNSVIGFVDLSVRSYQNKSFSIESSGGAKMTDMKINPTEVTFSVGWPLNF